MLRALAVHRERSSRTSDSDCVGVVADCFPATQKVQSFSHGPAGAFSAGEWQ